MEENIHELIESMSEAQYRLFLYKLEQSGIDLTEYLRQKSTYVPIKRQSERERYALSSPQKRMYILSSMEKESLNYNMPTATEITGDLDRKKLEKALKKIMRRQESLRTSFNVVDGEVFQRVEAEVEFALEYEEVRAPEQEEAKMKRIINGFLRPFRLENAPLFRAKLVRLGANRQVLLVDMHHIISDGTSMNILIREILAAYDQRELPELKISYKDYAAWQQETVRAKEMEAQKRYWQEQLSGELPVLDMHTDYSRPQVQRFAGKREYFRLDAVTTEELKVLCRKWDMTMNMLLLGAYAVLLSRYTGQEDIIIGLPIEGRERAEMEHVIGMFVNTLALRSRPEWEKEIGSYMEEVREECLRAYENQSYAFEDLVEQMNIRRDRSRNPIFDTMFVMYNEEHQAESQSGLEIRAYEYESGVSKFDVMVNATQKKDTVELEIDYQTAMFKRESIKRLGKHYINILQEIIRNPLLRIGEISLLNAEEKQSMRYTGEPRGSAKPLHLLFEERARETPERCAVVYRGKSWSYREIDQRTNRLARTLREKGVKANMAVGIMAERSLEMYVGILAILKAGGAYMPIGTEYPEERILYMLEDSGAALMVSQSDLKEKISSHSIREVLYLDEDSAYHENGECLEAVNTEKDLAYVIYTSGSTGWPKGVMVEHGAVVNTLEAMQKAYPLEKNDAYMLKTRYTFDVSVSELFGNMLGGGRMVILEEGKERDPDSILKSIEENGVTHISFVPSMLNLFLSRLGDRDKDRMSSVKYILSAGEELPESVVGLHQEKIGGVRLENIYGPTEAAVYATRYATKDMEKGRRLPIGKGIDNVRVYITDRNGTPQPIGVRGELCIGGSGLARGYLNKAELTNEKFVDGSSLGESRIYRTGDLARKLDDGNIEFLGRLDRQVKVRGFRIELGEIENQIKRYDAVEDAIAVIKEDEDGEKSLCAYYTSERELEKEALKRHLAERLPEYSIPPYIMRIKEIPLLENGKVDRKRLPEPEGRQTEGNAYMPPEDEMESRILSIWSELLKTEPEEIGVNDKFFEIGGNSLLVIKMHYRLEALFPGALSVPDLFDLSSVRDLTRFIKNYEAEASAIRIEPVKVSKKLFSPTTSNDDIMPSEFLLDTALIDRICEPAISNVRIAHIILAVFSYLLYEMAEQESITMCSVIGEEVVRIITISPDQFDSFFELIMFVCDKYENIQENKKFPAGNICKTEKIKGYQIRPILYEKGLCGIVDHCLDHFNLALEISETEKGLSGKFIYNQTHFSADLMLTVRDNFIALIHAYAESKNGGH